MKDIGVSYILAYLGDWELLCLHNVLRKSSRKSYEISEIFEVNNHNIISNDSIKSEIENEFKNRNLN